MRRRKEKALPGERASQLRRRRRLHLQPTLLLPTSQVWPLTQFSSVSFLLKGSLDLPRKRKQEGQIIDPSSRKYFSPLFPTTTSWSPSRIIEGLFEVTRYPSRALALCVAFGTTEKQGHLKVCHAKCAEVPEHCQGLTQTLIVCL